MTNEEDVVIDKVMSLSRDEFVVSVTRLLGNEVETEAQGEGEVQTAIGSGQVRISFQELPKKTLGGLLELPQAVVQLRFSDVGQEEREVFVRQFDFVFQRGGG